MTTRWLALFALACLAIAVAAQAPAPVPTLEAPTLVPYAPTATAMSPPLQSAVADIAASGKFRVGALYNDPPYSELTLQGELAGFDIALLRAIADAWGVDIEFAQVTRANAIDALERGRVDAVAAALLPYRETENKVDFTQQYLVGRQAVMVRADSPLASPNEIAGINTGVVIGTRAETALDIWRERTGIQPAVRQFLTLDRGFAALTRGDIDALLGEERALLRVAGEHVEEVKLLDDPLLQEPHAIAIRRFDAPLRNLLNRAIQRLTDDGVIAELQREYFPGTAQDEGAVIVWRNADDELTPAQASPEIRAPAESTATTILSSGRLRVAGIDAGNARLTRLNRELVNEMARRWGVSVADTAVNAETGLGLLRASEVDMVAGVLLDWNAADNSGFSMPYLLQGERLMIPARSQVKGFYDLRNRVVAVMLGDDDAWARAEGWADSIKMSIRRFDTTQRGAAQTLLEFNNANAVYANSLQLASHLDANPQTLKLTERWYSRDYFAFALPYNDADFRRLVDYTLQEMAQDGTLARLSDELLFGGDLPDFGFTPGGSDFMGLELSASDG